MGENSRPRHCNFGVWLKLLCSLLEPVKKRNQTGLLAVQDDGQGGTG